MGLDDITEKASDAGIEKAGDTAAKKSGGGNADQIDPPNCSTEGC
jgi:hypothetical protein